jgi:hypothetical protein
MRAPISEIDLLERRISRVSPAGFSERCHRHRQPMNAGKAELRHSSGRLSKGRGFVRIRNRPLPSSPPGGPRAKAAALKKKEGTFVIFFAT